MAYAHQNCPPAHPRSGRSASWVLGGQHPLAVQSMTNTNTWDVDATVAQIQSLSDAGCEIVRVTVPKAAGPASTAGHQGAHSHTAGRAISTSTTRMALGCLDAVTVALAVRLATRSASTPATSAATERFRRKSCARPGSEGSRCGSASTRAAWRRTCWRSTASRVPRHWSHSALRYIETAERLGYYEHRRLDQVQRCAHRGRELSAVLLQQCDYPTHLGITEAGTACLRRDQVGYRDWARCCSAGSATRSACRCSPTAKRTRWILAFDILQATGRRIRRRRRSSPVPLAAVWKSTCRGSSSRSRRACKHRCNCRR